VGQIVLILRIRRSAPDTAQSGANLNVGHSIQRDEQIWFVSLVAVHRHEFLREFGDADRISFDSQSAWSIIGSLTCLMRCSVKPISCRHLIINLLSSWRFLLLVEHSLYSRAHVRSLNETPNVSKAFL